jgi:hypothetical protein
LERLAQGPIHEYQRGTRQAPQQNKEQGDGDRNEPACFLGHHAFSWLAAKTAGLISTG